jgi:hypothetical protein
MVKWFDLYSDVMFDAQKKAELMVMLWNYALRCGDLGTIDTLTMEGNAYSVQGACSLLDCRGLYPDNEVLEWARQRIAKMPPPVPFQVFR